MKFLGVMLSPLVASAMVGASLQSLPPPNVECDNSTSSGVPSSFFEHTAADFCHAMSELPRLPVTHVEVTHRYNGSAHPQTSDGIHTGYNITFELDVDHPFRQGSCLLGYRILSMVKGCGGKGDLKNEMAAWGRWGGYLYRIERSSNASGPA